MKIKRLGKLKLLQKRLDLIDQWIGKLEDRRTKIIISMDKIYQKEFNDSQMELDLDEAK